jgi:hypothetical protein
MHTPARRMATQAGTINMSSFLIPTLPMPTKSNEAELLEGLGKKVETAPGFYNKMPLVIELGERLIA